MGTFHLLFFFFLGEDNKDGNHNDVPANSLEPACNDAIDRFQVVDQNHDLNLSICYISNAVVF